MRFSWWALPVSVIAAVLVCAFSGCSGRGAPAEPREFTALRTASTDHVTSLLMIKRWFSIMHTRTLFGTGPCTYDRQPVDPLRGDPPGSKRYLTTLSDCTTIDVLLLPDGSGTQVFHYPDGLEKRVEFSPARQDGAWRKIDLQEELWDDAQLDYAFGFLPGSPKNEQRWEGAATLADGRDMAFTLQRNDDWDHLELRPNDGSRLEVHVQLGPKPWTLWWPRFHKGADGSYQDSAGNTQDFKLSGPRDTRWQEWSFSAEDGTVGSFTIDEDFAGAGELTINGQVLGWLGWQSDGDAKLYPAGAGLLETVPSAAARDFEIDQWIRNLAGMGPDPQY